MMDLSRDALITLLECGYLSMRLGRFEEAREVFEGVSVLAPESEVPLVALGSTYFSQAKYDQAIRLYRKALMLKPDSSFVRAYLGESLMFQGKKDEALRELEKASSADPTGKPGDFARSLIELMNNGFTPPAAVRHS